MPKKGSKMAKFGFFSYKWLKFYITNLKFCIGTPFGIAHEWNKRVDQVPKYFGCKRQKFKKWKIKILKKSSKRAISRKIFLKISKRHWKHISKCIFTCTQNLVALLQLWDSKIPIKASNNGSKNSAILVTRYTLCRFGQTL